jgi:hypothetical protein
MTGAWNIKVETQRESFEKRLNGDSLYRGAKLRILTHDLMIIRRAA